VAADGWYADMARRQQLEPTWRRSDARRPLARRHRDDARRGASDVGGMYDPTYDVEAEKARHARERAGKRAALRAEGRFDEDGNPMDAAFDRGLASACSAT
jgi:hypothetical protein